MGTWPRLDGAPSFGTNEKNYDVRRRKLAHFIGMDFLFTQREYCQSLQIDNTGRQLLVNSSRKGELLAVRQATGHVLEKPWFNRKLRRPREYLGISKIDERFKKLSHMVHVITQFGIPTKAVLKSIHRLTLIWYNTRYEDMRKHVASITRKVIGNGTSTRNPGMSKKRLIPTPRFCGEKIHENGIKAPLWSYDPLATKG
jgi:hypothetical protein